MVRVAEPRGAGTDRQRLGTLAEMLGPRAQHGAVLAPYTAMRVGGPAELLVVAESAEELAETVRVARAHGVPWWVLGGGCNVLVGDEGLAGLVIINRAEAVTIKGNRVSAESGAKLASLARRTVDASLEGLAWGMGLPGTVGGAIVGNAGAFGGDIAGVLHSAEVLDANGRIVERENAWFGFGYRESCLKGEDAEEDVVLTATFILEQGDGAALRRRAAEVLEERRRRHPSGPTVGSTFKNPPGEHAGRLIEQAGLKGRRVGGARVSEQHANFLINEGGAKAEDVLALIEHIRAMVWQRCGVELTLEIEVLGDQAKMPAEGGR